MAEPWGEISGSVKIWSVILWGVTHLGVKF